MKKYIIISFISFLFCVNAFSQKPLGSQIEQARFQIVKNTVEFLATDKEKFGTVKTISSIYKTYADLIEYAQNNNLTRVDILVKHFSKIPIDSSAETWKSNLEKFKDDVIDSIASGPKARRRQLKGYKQYTDTLQVIVANVGATKQPATVLKEIPKDSIPTEKDGTEVTSLKTDGSIFSILLSILPYLIIAALSLFLLVIYNRLKNIKKSKSELKKINATSSFQIDNFKFQIKNFENELKKATEKIEELQQELKVERRRKLSNESQIHEPEIASAQQEIILQKKQEVINKYARYADQGDGFSISELLNDEDSETIFEIIAISTTTAKFKIANSVNAQKYALSNAAYFLGKTCKYDIIPSGSTTINTDLEGDLKLQGTKWLIINPAKISFC